MNISPNRKTQISRQERPTHQVTDMMGENNTPQAISLCNYRLLGTKKKKKKSYILPEMKHKDNHQKRIWSQIRTGPLINNAGSQKETYFQTKILNLDKLSNKWKVVKNKTKRGRGLQKCKISKNLPCTIFQKTTGEYILLKKKTRVTINQEELGFRKWTQK